MKRRDFLALTSTALAATAVERLALAKSGPTLDAAWFRRSRRFLSLPMGRIAYVERGRGPAALFLHGFPLNGFQWRGALERLHQERRCIAPDLLSLGHTEARAGQPITPEAQVRMLTAFLDALRIDRVDLVANDSGGIVAQLFVARHPQRVRTLILTNCDVDENSPPALFVPAIDLAKQGAFADKFLLPQLNDKQVARSTKGLGIAYTYPDRLTDDLIAIYLRPLVSSPLRKSQVDEYTVALGTNVLVPIRDNLRRWTGPARIVWGMKDILFDAKWADWLDRTLPGSRGVRRVEEARLFFPEEMPDVIAEEARNLWRAGPR
jgi:haloalkane dehalogenase